jgi:pimeloyl-ACP methyl ester carboxylesterase
MASIPETRYARHGDVHIAYQEIGDGPFDLLYVPQGSVPIDLMWDEPVLASALRRVASFCRLIVCDLRGWGSSDAVPWAELPAMQAWMDDLGEVLDAVGSEQAALFSSAESGLAAMLFAATHPERVRAMVVWSPYARFVRAPDHPWGAPYETVNRYVGGLREMWGTGELVEVLHRVAATMPASAAGGPAASD